MVCCMAGFNYDFETLRTDKPTNEVSKAFQALFQSPLPRGILAQLERFFPIFNKFFVSKTVQFTFAVKISHSLNSRLSVPRQPRKL